jgi:hypothetical protein
MTKVYAPPSYKALQTTLTKTKVIVEKNYYKGKFQACKIWVHHLFRWMD